MGSSKRVMLSLWGEFDVKASWYMSNKSERKWQRNILPLAKSTGGHPPSERGKWRGCQTGEHNFLSVFIQRGEACKSLDQREGCCCDPVVAFDPWDDLSHRLDTGNEHTRGLWDPIHHCSVLHPLCFSVCTCANAATHTHTHTHIHTLWCSNKLMAQFADLAAH